MKTSRIEHNLSFVPIHIAPSFGDTEIGIGTAFFYRHDGKDYFVTNWHNVTGRRPWDLSLTSKTAAIPDRLTVRVPYTEKDGEKSLFKWVPQTIKLYEDEVHEVPAWFEHPIHGRNVDAVAMPIDDLATTSAVAVNAESLKLSKLRLLPGMDAFVLGFPRGISGGGRFPIWKRASIASEPDIDIDGLPKFFIDTATREGMSGAPVYAQASGFWSPEGAKMPEGGVLGTGHRFVGIYSGRMLADDPFLAQLGIVWKEQSIIDIVEGKKRGSSSFSIVKNG